MWAVNHGKTWGAQWVCADVLTRFWQVVAGDGGLGGRESAAARHRPRGIGASESGMFGALTSVLSAIRSQAGVGPGTAGSLARSPSICIACDQSSSSSFTPRPQQAKVGQTNSIRNTLPRLFPTPLASGQASRSVCTQAAPVQPHSLSLSHNLKLLVHNALHSRTQTPLELASNPQ